ncbi:MAG TPA: nitrile hydratase subunit alpha [Gaiellales bacterium]|jgi:nitrile hydratase|nr:nitrile hydratase subunit alpha [Gaiellales bacterium]
MSDEHRHARPKSPQELRTAALEAVLIEKGLAATDAIDAVVDAFQNDIGPRNGARMVARAWVDEAYRDRLLANAAAAAAELGYGGWEGEHLRCVENTPAVHNVIVCTLCSCYPWPVLGVPPVWYKSPPYRSRVVREPRAVLQELGLELGDDVEVRVWDSSADMRYIVLPMRPEGTEGMSEEELADIVTRDCMIGVAVPRVAAPA